MATEVGKGYVGIEPDMKGFGTAVKAGVGREATGLKGTFSSLGGAAAKAFKLGAIGAGVGAGLFIKDAIGEASDLSESTAKVQQVFKDASGTVLDWSKDSARAFGQSKQSALEAASTYGNLFQAFGVGLKPATDMSLQLTELAADLASFNNTSVDDALLALRSGLTGETEPLKRYGVALSDVRLKQQAMSMGLISSTKEALTPAAKAQAAFALVMHDTALAQGDFQRTSGGLANQQRILGAQFTNLKATVGTALLPAFTSIVTTINDKVIPALPKIGAIIQEKVIEPAKQAVATFKENWPQIREVVLAALAPVIAWVTANWPKIKAIIVDTVTTIVTIVRGYLDLLLTIWRNYGDKILQYAQGVWTVISSVISGALQVIRGIIQTVLALIHGDWGKAWDGIKMIVSGVWTAITGAVRGAILQLSAIIESAMRTIGAVMKQAWEGLKSATSNAWNSMKNTVSTIIGNIVQFNRELPGKVLSAIGNVAATLAQKGKDLMTGFLNGAKNLMGSVTAWFAGIPGRIVSGIGDVGSKLLSIGSSLVGGIARGIRNAAHLVMEAIHSIKISWSAKKVLGVTVIPAGSIGLQTGGIVRARPGGVSAILGEGGRDEAVIPLPRGMRANALMDRMTAGSGRPIQVNFNGGIYVGTEEAFGALAQRAIAKASTYGFRAA